VANRRAAACVTLSLDGTDILRCMQDKKRKASGRGERGPGADSDHRADAGHGRGRRENGRPDRRVADAK